MPAPDVSPTVIAERVVEAILAQKLAPGERLGEQALAENFSVSRTMVRLTPKFSARACSPSRSPGASFCARIASTSH